MCVFVCVDHIHTTLCERTDRHRLFCYMICWKCSNPSLHPSKIHGEDTKRAGNVRYTSHGAAYGGMTSLKATNSIWTPLPYRIFVCGGLACFWSMHTHTHTYRHQINLLANMGILLLFVHSFVFLCFASYILSIWFIVNACVYMYEWCVSIFIAILTAWKMIYVPISLNYTQSYRSFIPIANILFA